MDAQIEVAVPFQTPHAQAMQPATEATVGGTGGGELTASLRAGTDAFFPDAPAVGRPAVQAFTATK